MNNVKSLEYVGEGTTAMIEKQDFSPYYSCTGVDDLLRAYPQSVTKIMAQSMFMLGYIHGKRAERARRKK